MSTVIITPGEGSTGSSSGATTNYVRVAATVLADRSLGYIKADGTVGACDATTEGKEVHGFIQTGVGSGAPVVLNTSGVISGFTGLIPGADYYMTTTPGVIGMAPVTTGNVVQKIGVAVSTTEIDFCIFPPLTL